MLTSREEDAKGVNISSPVDPASPIEPPSSNEQIGGGGFVCDGCGNSTDDTDSTIYVLARKLDSSTESVSVTGIYSVKTTRWQLVDCTSITVCRACISRKLRMSGLLMVSASLLFGCGAVLWWCLGNQDGAALALGVFFGFFAAVSGIWGVILLLFPRAGSIFSGVSTLARNKFKKKYGISVGEHGDEYHTCPLAEFPQGLAHT